MCAKLVIAVVGLPPRTGDGDTFFYTGRSLMGLTLVTRSVSKGAFPAPALAKAADDNLKKALADAASY